MVHRTAAWCISQKASSVTEEMHIGQKAAKAAARSFPTAVGYDRAAAFALRAQKLLRDRFPRPWDTIVQQLLCSSVRKQPTTL